MTVSYELMKRLEAERFLTDRIDVPHRSDRVTEAGPQEYVVVLSENGRETRELVLPSAPDIAMLARIAPNAQLAEVRLHSNARRQARRALFFAK